MLNTYSPLYVFRFCPGCGADHLKPDSEKSVQCESCGFKYYINMSAAVAAIICNENNEVLFTIRKHDPAIGMLDLPGGFVDLGETAEMAIAREVKEELNLTISSLDYLGTFTNKYQYKEIEYQTLDLVFKCSVESFDDIQVADDVAGYVFKNPSIVGYDEIGLESIRNVVAQIANRT